MDRNADEDKGFCYVVSTLVGATFGFRTLGIASIDIGVEVSIPQKFLWSPLCKFRAEFLGDDRPTWGEGRAELSHQFSSRLHIQSCRDASKQACIKIKLD